MTQSQYLKNKIALCDVSQSSILKLGSGADSWSHGQNGTDAASRGESGVGDSGRMEAVIEQRTAQVQAVEQTRSKNDNGSIDVQGR